MNTADLIVEFLIDHKIEPLMISRSVRELSPDIIIVYLPASNLKLDFRIDKFEVDCVLYVGGMATPRNNTNFIRWCFSGDIRNPDFFKKVESGIGKIIDDYLGKRDKLRLFPGSMVTSRD